MSRPIVINECCGKRSKINDTEELKTEKERKKKNPEGSHLKSTDYSKCAKCDSTIFFRARLSIFPLIVSGKSSKAMYRVGFA